MKVSINKNNKSVKIVPKFIEGNLKKDEGAHERPPPSTSDSKIS